MNKLTEVLGDALKAKTQSGSDYIARVTKIEGSTAYVQMAGSDIADTPVAMTIQCNVGDTVRVRVADGKAWITGNDTAPPSDSVTFDKLLELLSSGVLKIDTAAFKLDEKGNAAVTGTISADKGSFDRGIDIRFVPTNDNPRANIHIGTKNVAPVDIENDTGFTDIYADGITMMNYPSGGSASNPRLVTTLAAGLADFTDYSTYESTSIDASGVHHYSDANLKTDIRELDPDIARQLHPVKYRFNGSEQDRYGFVAQEVQKVMPNAVQERNGYLSLNYTELIAPLLALVQEQEARITKLEEALKGG